ncbi:helix-turn-helix domain-containing protein [Effusibacillus dendaii]|uniref:HTH-type transcriptional regulator Xre n=1 Tax=Effusibacillus dendaii TaxID=2743772 RepID=A0A7I8DDV0_9BACL|nr:helix-turn-helix transcriptional regulator [Effusibacillus dendaii]BCJ87452.1 HTH-type transcriptional regulator Xre [Effusibacillus dendaii]
MIEKRLSILRGNRTQQEVADALGISRARYAHYETGRNEPDLNTLVRLADFFQVPVDDLLGRSNQLKEDKTNYWVNGAEEIRELAELLLHDEKSRLFWKEFIKSSPEKRSRFLDLWRDLENGK